MAERGEKRQTTKLERHFVKSGSPKKKSIQPNLFLPIVLGLSALDPKIAATTLLFGIIGHTAVKGARTYSRDQQLRSTLMKGVALASLYDPRMLPYVCGLAVLDGVLRTPRQLWNETRQTAETLGQNLTLIFNAVAAPIARAATNAYTRLSKTLQEAYQTTQLAAHHLHQSYKKKRAQRAQNRNATTPTQAKRQRQRKRPDILPLIDALHISLGNSKLRGLRGYAIGIALCGMLFLTVSKNTKPVMAALFPDNKKTITYTPPQVPASLEMAMMYPEYNGLDTSEYKSAISVFPEDVQTHMFERYKTLHEIASDSGRFISFSTIYKDFPAAPTDKNISRVSIHYEDPNGRIHTEWGEIVEPGIYRFSDGAYYVEQDRFKYLVQKNTLYRHYSLNKANDIAGIWTYPVGVINGHHPECTSSYGWRKDPFQKNDSTARQTIFEHHDGIDFGGNANRYLRVNDALQATAPYKSMVKSVGKVRGHGHRVKIRILDGPYKGDEMTFSHLHGRRIYVQEGDTIDAGQRIAKIHRSGRSTGLHLHLEHLFTSTKFAPYMMEVIYYVGKTVNDKFGIQRPEPPYTPPALDRNLTTTLFSIDSFSAGHSPAANPAPAPSGL